MQPNLLIVANHVTIIYFGYDYGMCFLNTHEANLKKQKNALDRAKQLAPIMGTCSEHTILPF